MCELFVKLADDIPFFFFHSTVRREYPSDEIPVRQNAAHDVTAYSLRSAIKLTCRLRHSVPEIEEGEMIWISRSNRKDVASAP